MTVFQCILHRLAWYCVKHVWDCIYTCAWHYVRIVPRVVLFFLDDTEYTFVNLHFTPSLSRAVQFSVLTINLGPNAFRFLLLPHGVIYSKENKE